MTVQHKNIANRMIKRQIPGSGLPNGSGGSNGNGPPTNVPGGTKQPFGGPSSSPPSASNPGSPSSSSNNNSGGLTSSNTDRPTSSSILDDPSTTASQDPTQTTSRTTSSSTSSSTTSSTTSSTSSTRISVTSTSTFVRTAPTQIETETLASFPTTTGGITSTTPSASSTAAPSSGVKVASVVGGIAGALVGIAILGFLISFLLRRLRKRNRRDTIIGDDFRNSQFLADNDTGVNGNHNDVFEPPSMSQRHNPYTLSVASGPGMAGHGAFQSGAMYDSGAASAGGYGATAYGDAGAAGGAAVRAAPQERPRYTYGQHNDEDDDVSNGVFSSEPQPQVAYNPEAYGSYAAYHGGAAGVGYQEATREYQGQQHGGHDQGGYHGDSYGVAVADPGPSIHTPTAGAHPSAARDPIGLSGNRGTNTRSVVQDDDVYGGI